MRLKIYLTKIFLLAAFLLCITLAGFILYFAVNDAIGNNIIVPQAVRETLVKQAPKETEYFLPEHIKIPSIGVDADIVDVGLTSEGAVDAPKGPSDVGWFELSARPGAVGNTVMDGHAGYKNNIKAVFDNLYKLKKGDKIYVKDEKGTTITFVVRELRSYDRNQNPTDVFISNDGGAHLNLITCGGDWNATAKTHMKRLVVFADKEV